VRERRDFPPAQTTFPSECLSSKNGARRPAPASRDGELGFLEPEQLARILADLVPPRPSKKKELGPINALTSNRTKVDGVTGPTVIACSNTSKTSEIE